MHGKAPIELAPNLFKIARWKQRSIKIELQGDNWIRSLSNIGTTSEVEEFTLLFMAISFVQLLDQKDNIVYKWTPDGNYTVASTYDCQFNGSFLISRHMLFGRR
jgi:hypothetical protein